MENELATMLTELRQDHRNMAAMLAILSRESNAVYAEDMVDFETMRNVMLYMTIYPDAVHHPKEDQLYAELKAVFPNRATGMSRISIDHRKIAEQGIHLREMIDAAISGEAVRRKTIVADTLRYVETLKQHMHWEETDLFRRLDQMIESGHNTIHESRIIHGCDPLFGNSVDERFSSLVKLVKSAKAG